MFKIGDKVLYPMHGAGIIEDITVREIFDEEKRYYVMKMPVGDMKVMIPIDSSVNVGLREVVTADEANKVINLFKSLDEEMDNNWNKRYRENMEKLKGGCIIDVAKVVSSLLKRDNKKALSTGERKLFMSAKQILVSELVLSLDKTKEEIETLMFE